MFNGLRDYEKNDPIYFTLIVICYAIGASGIPSLINYFPLRHVVKLLVFAILKLLTVVLPVYLVFFLKKKKIFTNKPNYVGIFLCIPFLLVCLNNFPFISIFFKKSKLALDNTFYIYVIICLLISVFEEILFRVFVFDATKYYKKTGDKLLFRIIVTSALFSLCHLVNGFSLNIGYLIMQLGYSFLIGAMCQLSFIFCGNVFVPIVLHFVFDFGGLLSEYGYIFGNIWDVYSIIVTAVLGVIVFTYGVFVYFKKGEQYYESSYPKGE